MSAPRCLRCALETGSPFKRSRILYPQVHNRSYASDSASSSQPAVPVRSKIVSKQIPDAPPKRAPLPMASKPDESKTPPQTASKGTRTTEPAPTKRSKPVPPNVLAVYRTPVRLEAPHGIRVAQIQLRSYSIRNLEFFADFAMRVAQYLKLPASGPVPLPKKIERWTMTRSNFVHKKSQENFERITLRRLITIKDGNKRAVEVWLACLRKWQFYGVGMKANVWDWEGLDVLEKMDQDAKDVQVDLDAELANFGWNNKVADSKSIEQMFLKQGVKHAGVPMTEVRDKIKGAKNVELEG